MSERRDKLALMNTGRFLRRWWNRRRNRRSMGGDPNGSIRIVFANDCFGQPLNLERHGTVPGVRLSGNPAEAPSANALVFHIPTLRQLPSKPAGQLWVAWSMESEVLYPVLADPAFMRQFDLTMTYRRDSDVPLSYIAGDYEGILRLLRRPPPPKDPGHVAASLVSGNFDACGRTQYLAALAARMPVHAYGRRGTLAMPRPDRGQLTKRALLASYKFNLAFENSMATDYVTEKFYDPLYAGCVPVYRGASNVDDFAPGDDCHIDATRFRSPGELAEYLMHLDRDEAAYRRFFEWKTRPFRPEYLRNLETSTLCPHPFYRLALAVKSRC